MGSFLTIPHSYLEVVLYLGFYMASRLSWNLDPRLKRPQLNQRKQNLLIFTSKIVFLGRAYVYTLGRLFLFVQIQKKLKNPQPNQIRAMFVIVLTELLEKYKLMWLKIFFCGKIQV